ncbi:choice-of-anchor I family protein [Aliikangiella coralliicola]|uniref:choice-of-anchor I family protein n=1 Tax=Aliikangiella coralliicola TaxID=2592383 RepID=UPI00143D688C|nr:choice-of-anchor I family protein [Aliikangiella coralliicola]
MKPIKTVVSLAVACLLTACIDDGDDGANGVDGSNALVKQTALLAGHDNCFNGGIQIDSGIDTNGNAALDNNEITATEFVCSPAINSHIANLVGEKVTFDIDEKSSTLATASFSEGGRTGNDVDLSIGFGSGAYHHPGDPANVFYTISDRGPNIKCGDTEDVFGLAAFCLNEGNEVDGKIFPVPEFAPSIYQWALVENTAGQRQARILKVISLKDKDGNEISGISNPLTFEDGQSNTENAFANDGSKLELDPQGLDPEAIVKLSDGSFWIAEEYGVSILHVAADGRILKRIVPQGVESQLADANYEVEGALPAIYFKRKLNRGIESIAISPDENFLYFIMQSPLQNPDYRQSRHVRIMKYALSGGELGSAMGEYVYQLDPAESFGDGEKGDNGKVQKDVKISEMVAINQDDLIVLERISKTTKLYRINLASGVNILNSPISQNGVVAKESGAEKSLEDVLNLDAVNASSVHKSLVFNSLFEAEDLPKKIEGIAWLDANHVLLINDNDFGIEGGKTEINVLNIGEQLTHEQGYLEQKPELSLIGRYQASTDGEGAAEIVQYHQASQSVFTINGDLGNRIEVISVAGLTGEPLTAPLTTTNLNGISYDLPSTVSINGQNVDISDINSIAIHENKLAVAVAHKNDIEEAGVVLFYTLNSNGALDVNDYALVRVGVLPDSLAFTPDGSMIVVADEGEAGDIPADDQKGSISIIEVIKGTPGATATKLTFEQFNNTDLPGTNQNPEAIDFAHAVEPEYVAVASDSQTAYVTLQEMNALAVVDLKSKSITGVKGLGYKDHSLARNALDASDKDNKVNITSYDNLYGMYQPDTIVSYQFNGKTYLLTANEGDAGDGFQDVDERVEDLTLDPTAFPNASDLQTDDALGRLKVVPYLGKGEDGEYESLFAFGGRSFSIWDESGKLVFDSGADFEKLTAGLYGVDFNNDEDENEADTRSDAKGPEPEALAVGRVGERTYAFIGFERMGGIAMYDITNPYGVQYVDYVNNRDFTNIDNGDLAPEGMAFVEAMDSPTGYPLLIVGNEISGTVAVYQVN